MPGGVGTPADPHGSVGVTRFCSPDSTLPVRWASFAVCDCKNPDVVVFICVDDEVGETVSEIPAGTIGTQRPAFRVFGDDLKRPLDFGLEIEAEARGYFFVVRHGLPKLDFSFEEDRDIDHEYLALISANTSSAGRPVAAPSRTIVSRR